MGTEINGSTRAREICTELELYVKQHDTPPTIATILIGDSPASTIYINKKLRRAKDIGCKTRNINLEKTVRENDIVEQIEKLNNDSNINGILVQLPLPVNINTNRILNAIDPIKDIDGLNAINQGKLMQNNRHKNFYPCTALACFDLIKSHCTEIKGKNIAVIGKSNLVGMPSAIMLANAGATVSITHALTKDLQAITKKQDIVICATGNANFFNKNYFNKKAIVIDVGINKVKGKTLGDVNYEQTIDHVAALSVVPKGVGPMTIACLMYNLCKAHKLQNKLNTHLIDIEND